MIDASPVDLKQYDTQSQLLKVLSHPARLAILNILREGEQCVCHMEAHLGYRQAYISQQLMVLRDSGLIQDRRDGWNVFYHVADPKVFSVLTAVEQMVGVEEGDLEKPQAVVACPCPKCSGSGKG